MPSANPATDLEIPVMLVFDLEFAFNEEQPCEHSNHNEFPAYHNGNAEWYLNIQCIDCGNESGLYAACDLWVKSLKGRRALVECKNGCGRRFQDWNLITCERMTE